MTHRLFFFGLFLGLAFLAHRYFISWENISMVVAGFAVAAAVSLWLAVRK